MIRACRLPCRPHLSSGDGDLAGVAGADEIKIRVGAIDAWLSVPSEWSSRRSRS